MLAGMNAALLGALGGGLNVADVFATTLYTGNGAARTINNGIDLAGEGGLVWIKGRTAAYPHALHDTLRGPRKFLQTNSSNGEATDPAGNGFTAFTASGFSLGPDNIIGMNAPGINFVSWAFRRAPKFFDVVTYTGNGVNGRQIPHSLGTTPGMVLVKRLDAVSDWVVWHRSASGDLVLNSAAPQAGSRLKILNAFGPYFLLSADFSVNASGGTYVAYLFAHDPAAGGIIQCGSYVGNGSTSGPIVTLGWQPQYLLIKNATNNSNWFIIDAARGMGAGNDPWLAANVNGIETTTIDLVNATPNGFQIKTTSSMNTNGDTIIYMAIRGAA